MSIDNIQITGYLCEKMFSNSLLIREKTERPVTDAVKNEISGLGENGGHILFIVQDAQNKFLGDREMKLLTDLLTACRLSMADIALVNYGQGSKFNYRDLNAQFQPEKILIFGVTSSDLDLPFNIPFFQLQNFHAQVYMMAPPLTDFLDNTDLKKSLWNSLKKIFL